MKIQELQESTKLGLQLWAPHPHAPLGEALKPSAKLWTSTARQTDQGWTSDWVQWALAEMPEWVGRKGVLFEPNPGARILTIRTDRDAMRIARELGVKIKHTQDLFRQMPWDQLRGDWDAIHYSPVSNPGFFMSAWDVESTAWFDSASLTRVKTVDIDHSQQ